MTTIDWTEWDRVQARARIHQNGVVKEIVAALPEDEWDHEWLLNVFAYDPNNLVDLLGYYGIYDVRVSWNHNRVISEPINGAKVPRLSHLYCGHRDARIEIV